MVVRFCLRAWSHDLPPSYRAFYFALILFIKNFDVNNYLDICPILSAAQSRRWWSVWRWFRLRSTRQWTKCYPQGRLQLKTYFSSFLCWFSVIENVIFGMCTFELIKIDPMSETFIALSTDRLLVKVKNNNYPQVWISSMNAPRKLILLIWALKLWLRRKLTVGLKVSRDFVWATVFVGSIQSNCYIWCRFQTKRN